ncbi:ATP-dependent DNA helicase 2 subunit KU70 isoform X2 [Humulus lupulus]|uniref:ATP-dependent DNA helicase 2 subunit KU70 isoform X2 n=1 Tax=Humulus lupulus TaxID=3486 RepID=UPI002B40D94A|nr:ATP-dependent DNA helicase 2 subunit KU70 isoform X2 [Humulus lupulus]
MDLDMDPDDIFRDDEDDFDNDLYKQREATKEFVVYLVDASPKMFNTTSPDVDNTDENHFHIAHSCISQSLKTQIINSSYDEVAICFFNTREKKNLQDLNGVFVFNVADRDYLDRPTARLIKEFDLIEESFMKDIGSRYGIVSGSRDNSLYNAIWVAQALLRKGSAKTADKRILLFTNEDDPFGGLKGAVKIDMVNTTLQRAKDAQDLGISIEVLPLGRPEEEFNISLFYADLIGLEGDELAQFMPSAGERLEDMKDQLRKRLFKKRIVRKINFAIANGLSIELNTYALIRPTTPGAITWLDSVTNHPLKTERSFICADTGALLQNSTKLFYPYKNESIKLSVEELSEIKRTSIRNLRLLGFKSLSCLKDYHNLRPSTFLFPSEEDVIGSTCIFIALHRSMLRLKRFAVAFYGLPTRPQLVALVAQEEITKAGGQVEPPGMHMIYLPYSDDIRDNEELHSTSGVAAPCATDEQVRKAASLMKRIDLKDFSVCQFANPALQRHYAVLQTLALDEDEMPDIKDETVPDEEGMSRPGVVNALEEFKLSIYGDTYDEETENAGDKKESEASKKRKATSEIAVQEYAKYDWGDLADNGKLKDLTAAELKYYLTANNIPVAGKKEALISRILTHMGK